ncbi:MAG: transglutaminase family protein, partial [Cyanobacteria bacterium P01_H01_bin.15]
MPIPALSRTLWPQAAYIIQGLAVWRDKLLAIDSSTGYLLEIDPGTDNTRILNSESWSEFVGVLGIAVWEDTLWFTSRESVYCCELTSPKLQPKYCFNATDLVEGIAVRDDTIYLTCQRRADILIYKRSTGSLITHLYAPGIGRENIVIQGEELWVTDDIEQTVYCLDRGTGDIKFSVLTPFAGPTALAFYRAAGSMEEVRYVAYADSEPYIRDNPNAEPNFELQYRDRTFLHPLNIRYNEAGRYARSNGFLVELTYTEEISPLDPFLLENLEWRIALPAETDRQKIRLVEPVGMPFTEEIIEGQRIAVFKFPKLTERERYVFGWRAQLEVWSIKYQLQPPECESLPALSAEYTTKYLQDDDDLAMGTDIILRSAESAIGTETNLLRKMYSIRNYVYDRLSYGIKPHIDTPDIVLRRGVGSCGEYLGVLLALSRLNGIACRTVGRYNCPPHPQQRKLPLITDFKHVWIEFFVPGFGWLPMESNPDD